MIHLLRFLDRTPVYLRDEDGIGIHHGHSIVETIAFVRDTGIIVAAVIPARIVMNGITDVIAGHGIGLITAIVRLIARTRHPDDARKTIGTDLVNDGLEEIVQCFRIILSLSILQVHGLIGQFDADLSGVLTDGVVLREDIPHSHQILVVIVANLDVVRTDARRTDHHIHAVVHGFLGQGEIDRFQIGLQSVRIKLLDVSLTRSI